MRTRQYLVTAAAFVLVAGGALFGISMYSASTPEIEHTRLSADLDGDDKPETVSLSTSGTDDFRRYSVRAGAATFGGEFFAASGELPIMKIIQIDTSTKQNQLLITTPSPVDCGYVILALTQGKFLSLLEHNAKNCEEPRARGNELETLTWEGFWNRPDRYTLDKQNVKLNQVNQKIYPVSLGSNAASATEAAGVAREPLALKPADCKGATIAKGSRVVVKSYDALQKRYLLKGSAGSCGWIPESDLQMAVDGLPWAG